MGIVTYCSCLETYKKFARERLIKSGKKLKNNKNIRVMWQKGRENGPFAF
jgi:hypothetical protein